MTRKVIYNTLLNRVNEPRRFLQVLAGARQVGKTTVARQVMSAAGLPAHYASADEPTLRNRSWLEQQWDLGRLKSKEHPAGALLVLDEIQKVPGWSDTVKLLWDADSHAELNLKVVLLGSSPLLMQTGLTESLAGRFEIFRCHTGRWARCRRRSAGTWNSIFTMARIPARRLWSASRSGGAVTSWIP